MGFLSGAGEMCGLLNCILNMAIIPALMVWQGDVLTGVYSSCTLFLQNTPVVLV